MAVHYEVLKGQNLVIAGPANVTVKGGETPVVVTDMADFESSAPTITLLDPDSAESGSADIIMKITGENLTAESVIVFGEYDEPTTYNEDGTISTGVKPSIFAPATVPVRVRNGPARSQPVDFTFTDPAVTGMAKKRRS